LDWPLISPSDVAALNPLRLTVIDAPHSFISARRAHHPWAISGGEKDALAKLTKQASTCPV
jgi:hypothetical protein